MRCATPCTCESLNLPLPPSLPPLPSLPLHLPIPQPLPIYPSSLHLSLSPCTRMNHIMSHNTATYQVWVWVWVDLWVHWRALGWAVESSSTVDRTAALAPDSRTIACCSCQYCNKSNLVHFLHRQHIPWDEYKTSTLLTSLRIPRSHIRTGSLPGTCATSRRRSLDPSHYSGQQ